MSTNGVSDHFVRCPSCGAVNTPNIVVCESCGVNPRVYNEVVTPVQEVRAGAAVVSDSHPTITEAVEAGRRQLITQLRWLMVIAGISVILVVAGSLVYSQQRQSRERQLERQYSGATACFQQRDFLCARDGFVDLASQRPPYRDSVMRLQEARYELAGTYASAGNWTASIGELTIALEADPNDHRALTGLQDVYDRWHMDAVGRGDWLTALRVSLQRRARFP